MFLLPDLSRRWAEPEVMDQPDLDAAAHERALTGLGRLNSVSASARLLWPAIWRLACDMRARSLRVLDLASGGGDVTIELWRLARRRGLRLSIVGCDLSSVAVEYARRRGRIADCDVEFRVCDVLREPLPTGFDVVASSLFLHHLERHEAVRFLRRIAQSAGQMVLVNDLRRCIAGYILAQAACRLLTPSPVVRVDGPRSVRNAFTTAEMAAMCAEAGLAGATIRRKWPCRMLVAWKLPR